MDGVSLFVKAFFRRIINDFRHKELLPLKLLFFVHSSTVFVLYPYLTIHMRELGINVEETAIMSAVTPVVAIIMPPLAGMVADRIGNFKILLASFSALGGAAALLLLLVPVGRMTITYPDHVIMDLGCQLPGRLHLGMSVDQPCDRVNDLRAGLVKQVETQFEACGFLCSPDPNPSYNPSEDLVKVLRAHSYQVTVSSGPGSNVTDTYSYTLNPEDMPALQNKEDDARNHRVYKNNDHYRTSIRSLSEGLLFFPTTGLYNLSCVRGQGYNCAFGSAHLVEEGVSTIPALKKVFRTALAPLGDGGFAATALNNWTDPSADAAFVNASCTDIYNQEGQRVYVTVPLHDPENAVHVDKELLLSSCKPRCLVTIPRGQVCSDMKADVEYDVSLTFWLYLCIRVFIGMIGGTAFAMFEGAVIAILREHKADYGLQRIYATIGGMISSPLSGILIDYASRGKGYTDFRPAFYLYAGLKIASGLLILTINLEFKVPAKNVVTDVLTVLKNVELVALFFVIFVLGSAWGYIESFLFWLLQDLGGTRSLMGITITVGGIAGIPLLVLSGPIIDKIGHANVLFIGFIFYSIRLLGYSLIYNPWLCLIFEAMESVTSSLSFTAAVTYAAKLSTSTTDSSIQGLLGGLYFGVGKGAGSLVGGYLMKWIGTRPTYQVFSVMCGVVGIAYFLFNKLYLRKRPQTEGNDIVKKKSTFLDAGDMVEIDLTGSKDKKQLNQINANNNAVETLPINTTASKSYDTADNNLKNLEASQPKKPVEACNVNLGYDEDDYESIDESPSDKEHDGKKASDEPTKDYTAYDNPNLELGEEKHGSQNESILTNRKPTKDADSQSSKEEKNQKNLNKFGSA